MKALAISALIFVGVLGSAVGWFALNPDPMAGEPSVTVAIEAAEPEKGTDRLPAQAAEPAAHQETAALVEQAPAPAAEPQPVPAPEPSEGQAAPAPDLLSPSADPEPEAMPELAKPAPPPAPLTTVAAPPEPPAIPPSPTTEAAATAMPFGALIEQSRYGPLPKIASDGRRPADVYANNQNAVPTGPDAPARVAVLITGLGLSDSATGKAIEGLPAPVTLGFGAYGRNLQDWVARARSAGHEVMLQIPLEPYDYPDNDPGPHTLLTSLPPDENVQRLRWLMSRFTGYVGVTNHMGAKFVSADESFLPVLEEIKARGLVYLDDGAAARSAAGQVATGIGLPFSVAQVQLDAVPAQEELERSLAKLEALAKERGLAIAVGSALPMTVERLHKWIDGLSAKGITLIPVSAAIRVQHQS